MKTSQSNSQGNVPPIPVVPTYNDEQGNPLPIQSPKKSPWKRFLLIFFFLVALLGVGGYIAYTYLQETRAEEQAFQNLEGSYVIQSYEDYLTNFPKGKHVQEVQQRLGRLKQMQSAWSQILYSTNPQDFVAFKNRFRDNHYDVLCDTKIDSLDWMNALTANTPESYQFYMSNHPNGRYRQQAQNALQQTEQSVISDDVEIAIHERLALFYDAFGRNEGLTMCRYIVPVMDNFLGKRQATKSDVLCIVERMFTPAIESCNFSFGDDLKIERLTGDNQLKGYKVTMSVDQQIERNDPGKTFGSYVAEIHLSDQLMITSVQMREISSKKSTTSHSDNYFD